MDPLDPDRDADERDNADGDAVIAALGLVPHPEGGHYRQTWVDEAGTAIYFLLRADERSAWHRVHGRAEIWHFYAGAPLELHVVDDAPAGRGRWTTRLGPDLAGAELPQAVVPPGAWQSARSLGRWTLVGCTVSPPFTFDAFELAPDDRLPDDCLPDDRLPDDRLPDDRLPDGCLPDGCLPGEAEPEAEDDPAAPAGDGG